MADDATARPTLGNRAGQWGELVASNGGGWSLFGQAAPDERAPDAQPPQPEDDEEPTPHAPRAAAHPQPPRFPFRLSGTAPTAFAKVMKVAGSRASALAPKRDHAWLNSDWKKRKRKAKAKRSHKRT